MSLQFAQQSKPNILVIIVDQLRVPMWFPQQEELDGYLPGLAALRKNSVEFTQYFTAASFCTPARSTLLTGLYAPQTGVQNTENNDENTFLNPGFPTWGTLLRKRGYETYWWGKWHLSDTPSLENYGFSGGTFPSPNGGAGQGLRMDPFIVQQYLNWLTAQSVRSAPKPWCTTVSLINPHDETWYPRGTACVPALNNAPRVFKKMPANFEKPETLWREKPVYQQWFQHQWSMINGPLPYSGEGYEEPWLRLLDIYLYCQQCVDREIHRVLSALDSSPFAKNTIVLFLSDHGEHGGSHGLRTKGGSVYEESIHVPLYIRDLDRKGSRREQLVSSVDIPGLLLTLANGNNGWRDEAECEHLKERLHLAEILRDASRPGRPYILSTVDEDVPDETVRNRVDGDIPHHVIGLRTRDGKLGHYSRWKENSFEIDHQCCQLEYYNYQEENGTNETLNQKHSHEAKQYCARLFDEAIPQELRLPLPEYLHEAQCEGYKQYYRYLTTLLQDWSI